MRRSGAKSQISSRRISSRTSCCFAASSSTDRAFVNVSSRDRIATADGVCIAGFVSGGSSPRNVLLRAVGPSLAPLGVTDPLPDPTFTVHHGNVTIAANDNWADAGAAALATAFSRVGAFDFLSPTTRDAAMMLRPDPGVYSMVARSADGSPGTGPARGLRHSA